MTDSLRSKSCIQGNRQQTSRLQRRAPASLQISAPSSNWNVAIPLLSPLDASPSSSKLVTDRTVALNSREEQRQQVAEPEKVVLKKWQHPPFSYDPAPRVRPFVPV
ncbi:uncharacterized protein At4g14450, chloroplastic-like [Juglans microcarpa x Juglans regia]|uniref:uncharacterized protein At4g14450, chloroplastic-like n=1 Tax=Juglans microcarpa x Juglans regia TaxID=2249226 RepID=UPI001B7E61B6|nr:uncharacterized protein At4g14450, chloroplastic-like [Juglans microcarpa x Juglans regia]